MDKRKHHIVSFCTKETISRHIRNPFFKNLEERRGVLEIMNEKSVMEQGITVQIVVGVYSRAKLMRINFWRFLKKHPKPKFYCVIL